MLQAFLSMIQGQLKSRRLSTIVVGLLAAVKIITDAFGWHVITNQEVNAIANGLAALLTVLTVVMSHMRSEKIKTDKSSTGGTQAPSRPASTPIVRSHPSTPNDPVLQPEAASDGYAR